MLCQKVYETKLFTLGLQNWEIPNGVDQRQAASVACSQDSCCTLSVGIRL